MIRWRSYLAVGIGSGLGALLRALVGQWVMLGLGDAFVWGTLAVNLLGSWLIAAFATRAAHQVHSYSARWHPFLVVGFCGGFTTFSMFGLEVVYLLESAHPWHAAAYIIASALLWITAAWHGQHTQQARMKRGS